MNLRQEFRLVKGNAGRGDVPILPERRFSFYGLRGQRDQAFSAETLPTRACGRSGGGRCACCHLGSEGRSGLCQGARASGMAAFCGWIFWKGWRFS